MTTQRFGRRMFLRGTGGAQLAIPFLPSLLVNAPRAEAAAAPRRFVAFVSEHGALQYQNMYPDSAVLNERRMIPPGYEMRFGKLSRKTEAGDAFLSPVLRASASVLTDTLAGKINVLRGIDIPFGISHHFGGLLGNFDANRGPPREFGPARPTIDQIMATSPRFYQGTLGVRQRSIFTGFDTPGTSWGWSNPIARSGTITASERVTSTNELFRRLFGDKGAVALPTNAPQRKPIVDRVIASYRRLREGNRRLSLDDRRRLDDHIARLSELERKVALPTVNCTSAKAPATDSKALAEKTTDVPRFLPLVNELIATAFACDVTRIAVVNAGAGATENFGGSWHQDVAHQSDIPENQQRLVQAHRGVFEKGLLDLASRLDGINDAAGGSVLDSSLLCWTQECGRFTHDSDSIPIVTAGAAGGTFRTGYYCDYRNQISNAQVHFSNHQLAPDRYAGLMWYRWLANALTAMGVPKEEWQRPGEHGYGAAFPVSEMFRWAGAPLHKPGTYETSSDPLPVIAA